MRSGAACPQWAAFFLLLLGLAACGSAPRKEVRGFRDSMQAVTVVAAPIFDDLSVLERRAAVFKAENEARRAHLWVGDGRNGVPSEYHLADAGIWAEIRDPPRTAALRAGLATLSSFASALGALADDANLAEGEAEVSSLVQTATTFTSLVMPASAPEAKALATAASLLTPVVGDLIKADNGKRMRDIILGHQADVTRLIAALREATPAMYALHATDLNNAIAGPPRMPKPLQEQKLAGLHAQLSRIDEYVMLLNQSAASWNAAVAAASAKQEITLALLAASADSTRADLEAIQKARAAVRNK